MDISNGAKIEFESNSLHALSLKYYFPVELYLFQRLSFSFWYIQISKQHLEG